MSDLQFETAEYAEGVASCAACRRPVVGTHWMSGANTVCGPCHDRLEAELSARAPLGALGRAAGLGFGACLLGGLGWYGIREATGYEFGILAIAVAWGVATAVTKAAGGGRAQQALAVGFTYLAVVVSYLPSLIAGTWAEASGPLEQAFGVVVAVALAFGLPFFLAQNGDFLWFVIVGIALWSAFRRTARPQIAWTGPFQAAPAP